MDTYSYFQQLINDQKHGKATGICSICSSNTHVIAAAMEYGRDNGLPVLVEATANQVNQLGGYTGMTPNQFMNYALGLADSVGLNREQLILGGDHLGPLIWSDEPEETAMKKAEALVAAFVRAGFTKIHLDTSMRLKDDPTTERLPDETIARRAARLCTAAEKAAENGSEPVYVIGSEVPVPGGATENEDFLAVTSPEELQATLETFHSTFSAAGLQDAFSRVVAVVVQPGVEFADNTIMRYVRENALALTGYVRLLPSIVLEGHSTDYQPHSALTAMREDGIAILKVGPALTFAVREAFFALESIERILFPLPPENGYSEFSAIVERTMLKDERYWKKYYGGTPQQQAYARKYSLSDRCRYYFDTDDVQNAMKRLIENISGVELPFGLISQYFPMQKERFLNAKIPVTAEMLIHENVKNVLRTYY